MSMPENPYQSPVSAELVVEAEIAHPDELWRHGKLLVMRKTARLPKRCVKSNQPTERWLERSLAWHHPAVFLTIPAGLLIYIVVALILTKRATIRIGLSQQWFARRRRAIFIGWTIVLSSIASAILGLAWMGEGNRYGLLFLFGFVGFWIGAFYGLLAARMVAPKRMNDEFVWLKGVHPEFLADLPEWPAVGRSVA